MRWCLGGGNLDKILVVKAWRLRQYWFCHLDIVISSEAAHDFDWRVMDWPKAPAQFRECLALYSLDEVAQDVIEHADLLIIKPVRVGNKKIGYTSQRVDTL